MSRLPIADYALLSDCHSAALVSRGGSIDWLCFPRFDSPSVFGRILDDARRTLVDPARRRTPFETTRRYVDDTMLLETTFTTATARSTLTDALAVGRNERGHELGAGAVGTVLRRVVGVDGDGGPRAGVRAAARVRARVHRARPGGRTGSPPGAGPACSRCRRRCRSRSTDPPRRARFSLRAGESAVVRAAPPDDVGAAAPLWTQTEISDRLDDTAEAWRTWSSLHQAYDGPWADLVHHSGRVLYGLTYFPTGAIVRRADHVAPGDARRLPQLGLPLRVGARRVVHAPGPVGRRVSARGQQVLRLHLADAAAAHVREGADLQIMFGIGGEHDLTERELGHLSGWRDSAPVRIGNGAWNQRQLDVYGELLDAAHRLPEQLDRLGPAYPPVPRRPGRHRGRPLAGAGPGHLGGPGRAAPLPVLQAHVLGRARPGDHARRPPRRAPIVSTDGR